MPVKVRHVLTQLVFELQSIGLLDSRALSCRLGRVSTRTFDWRAVAAMARGL